MCLDPPGTPLKKTLTEHSDSVNSVCFSPDGRYIASGSFDKTIKLWEVGSGVAVKTLTGHYSGVRSIWDMTIKLWDAESKKEIASFFADFPIHSFAISKKNLIAAGGYRTVFFLDVIVV